MLFCSIAAVEGVKVTALNRAAVFISWHTLIIEGFSIANYTVEYSQLSGFQRRQNEVMSVVFPPSSTSGVISGLRSGATYQFQVYATIVVDGRAVTGERSPLKEDSMIRVEGEILNTQILKYGHWS